MNHIYQKLFIPNTLVEGKPILKARLYVRGFEEIKTFEVTPHVAVE